jgi:hypothetical protein
MPGSLRWRVTRNGQRAGVTNGRPPGTAWSKPIQTPRAGRLGFGGLAALHRFDKPRCREASRPVGPSTLVCAHCVDWRAPGPLASRAPSVLFRAGGLPLKSRRRTRRRKETGRRSCVLLGCLKSEFESVIPGRERKLANPESRPRNSACIGIPGPALARRPGMTMAGSSPATTTEAPQIRMCRLTLPFAGSHV